MRAILGWAAAVAAGALLGVAVYHVVLADPSPRLAAEAVVPSAEITPEAVPTVYRTETRTVVDPTPTVTVEEVVVVTRTATPGPPAAQGSTRRTAPGPATPTRRASGSAATRSPARTAEERDDREKEDRRDSDDRDAGHEEHEEHEEDDD